MTALLARLVGVIGALAAVACIAMWAVAPELPGLRTLAATAAVGIAGWLYLDWPAVSRLLASQGGAAAGRSALLLATLAAIAGVAVALAEGHPRRWDLTPQLTHSLSPRSGEVLAGLSGGPVEVTGWFSAGGDAIEQGRRARWDALADAFSTSDHLVVRTLDPDAAPREAMAAGISSNGVVVVQRGERREQVPAPDEQALLNAVLRVASAREQAIYFSTGQGERSPGEVGPDGLGALAGQLSALGFRVGLLDLSRADGVPEDAALLAVVDPKIAVPAAAAEWMAQWVRQGGALLLAAEPGADTGLNPLLASAGLGLSPQLVLDPLVRSVTGDESTPLVARYGLHPSVRDLRAPAVFPGVAAALEVPHDPLSCTVYTLAWSSEAARTEATADSPSQPGPLPLLSLAELHPGGVPGGMIALSGDADWLGPASGQLGNPDLIVRLFGSLAREQDLVTLPPRPRAEGSLQMGWLDQVVLGLVALLLLPGGCFAVAAGLWMHRSRL